VLGVEEVGELGVGVRMGAAHEAIADEADADWFFHEWEWDWGELCGVVTQRRGFDYLSFRQRARIEEDIIASAAWFLLPFKTPRSSILPFSSFSNLKFQVSAIGDRSI
jgi:hypothetical protein